MYFSPPDWPSAHRPSGWSPCAADGCDVSWGGWCKAGPPVGYWQVSRTEALRAVRDCQRVVGVALRQHQQLLPRNFGDVAPGLHNGDRELLPKPPAATSCA